MTAKEFLQSVLGDTGHYCVFAYKQGSKRLAQKFYTDLDNLLDFSASLDAEGFNTFFALATFKTDGERTQKNAKELRSFFLDLDVDDAAYEKGRGYLSQRDALVELKAFVKDANLPKPYVMNSGRGIHAYWPLSEPVAVDRWKVVAERFKALASDHLSIDPSVPADAARVLRIPGTHNYKSAIPKKVVPLFESPEIVTFEEFSALVGGKTPTDLNLHLDADMLARAKAASASLHTALQSNERKDFMLILRKTQAGKGCKQLGLIASDNASASYDVWRSALSIAAECEDPELWAKRLSQNHPDYEESETIRKLNDTGGPHKCTTFNSYRPGICETCPNWGKITSPIQLGRTVATTDEEVTVRAQVMTPGNLDAEPEEEEIVIPVFPKPYARGKFGGVCKVVKDEDVGDVSVMVYPNDLYVVRRVNDPDEGEMIVMRLHLPKDGVREFVVPLSVVSSKDRFREHIAKHGVAVTNATELLSYTLAWIHKLQNDESAKEARRQFGWSDDSFRSFIIGDREIFGDHIARNPPSRVTQDHFAKLRQSGTLEDWKQTLALWDEGGYEAHQFTVGISFGAPLMAFTPINGACFHLYNKRSGFGKTTALNAGASVWGNPKTYVLQQRDTFASKMARAEVYKNLPVFLDEITNVSGDELSDFAYSVPSGMQPNRMSQGSNKERWRGDEWYTLFASTGNTSIIERVYARKTDPEAELQRVMEIRAKDMKGTQKNRTDRLDKLLKRNYGHAGPLYVQYLINHITEVQDLRDEIQLRFDARAELTHHNRFWSAAISCVLTGLTIAKRLGFITWDIDQLTAWCADELVVSMRSQLNEVGTSTEEIINTYMQQFSNDFLRITGNADVRRFVNESTETKLMLVEPESVPRNQLRGRYEYDTKLLYLSPTPFKIWCAERQINYYSFCDELTSHPRLKGERVKVRMYRGTTQGAMPAANAWKLDFSSYDGDLGETPIDE